MASFQVHFGGPGSDPFALRNLLAEKIAAVPPGGRIDWITYYLRDRRLAADLLEAKRRGVEVFVTLDGCPRTPDANDAVIDMLAGTGGLDDGLRCVGKPGDRVRRAPRLHEKLYCFSHPEPVALVGSFNPSGDAPELRPEIVAEIGNHDRAFNTLVEVRSPQIVERLRDHARASHVARYDARSRFRSEARGRWRHGRTELFHWPRATPHPVEQMFDALRPGDRVRVVTSHLKGRPARASMLDLAARGVQLDVLCEHTERRVSAKTERAFARAGISMRRVLEAAHPLPMHDKFVLIERRRSRTVIFGSFNWTRSSRRDNVELGVAVHDDPHLFAVFDDRWERLAAVAKSG